MAEILRYVLVTRDNHEEDYEYDRYHEAETAARERGTDVAIIERHYVYDDSELVWTPDGADTWPPNDPTHTK
jgi:hypothetical protein